jgi:hypothetical protein
MRVFLMTKENFDEQARLRRKKAMPALLAAALAFTVFFGFSGFNFGAILSLVVLVMVSWYMITIRYKLELWANEESIAIDSANREREIEVRIDDDLGDVILDEESEQWIVYPRGKGGLPTIVLAADWDEKAHKFLLNTELRSEALMLSKKIEELKSEVDTFLKRETLRLEFRQYSESVEKLEIEQISLLWAKHSADGVIHFKAIDATNFHWMCKIHHGKPIEGSLVFDT